MVLARVSHAFKKYFYPLLAVTLLFWVVVGIYLWCYSQSDIPLCDIFPVSVRPAQTEREPFSREDPSGGRRAPSGWAVYVDEDLGYKISYPSWMTPAQQDRRGPVRLKFFAPGDEESLPTAQLYVFRVPFERAEKVVRESLPDSKVTFQEYSVAGRGGLLSSGKFGKKNLPFKEVDFPAPHEGLSFRIIVVSRGHEQEDYREIFEQMVESFSFL